MTDAFYCSYCARRQHDVRKLIAGPGPRLFICDACVDLCHEIVHPPADKKPARFLTGYQPGSYGCHEAMHMAFVLQELVARQLLEHRAITSRPEWAKLAQTAFDTLFELYQAIDREHLVESHGESGERGQVIGFGALPSE